MSKHRWLRLIQLKIAFGCVAEEFKDVKPHCWLNDPQALSYATTRCHVEEVIKSPAMLVLLLYTSF